MLREIELEDFEHLTDRYFGRGFASLTKTEVEVYLFDIYMRGIERTHNKPSYYAIGRELGIPDSRVRTLSEKRSLFFYEPPSVDECLIYLLEHAPKDLQSDVIRIQVSDVNILRALQDYIESRELGYEPELTGKAFRIRLSALFDLLEGHFGQEVTYDAVRQVFKQAKRDEELAEVANARKLKELVRDPETYASLLQPLLVDGNPVSFLCRLGSLIREAQRSEADGARSSRRD